MQDSKETKSLLFLQELLCTELELITPCSPSPVEDNEHDGDGAPADPLHHQMDVILGRSLLLRVAENPAVICSAQILFPMFAPVASKLKGPMF